MAYPWSRYPIHVILRLDLGISRIQLSTEYWRARRIEPLDLPGLALET